MRRDRHVSPSGEGEEWTRHSIPSAPKWSVPVAGNLMSRRALGPVVQRGLWG
jgi:hypothetical protein